jgi:ArsR family transcriptional regulator, arsenate/arsenite/antimonite-responsive transcriptional repressor
MRELMTVTRALADENRVRILVALQDGELCVCQLIALLGIAPSTVSKHLSILRQARLVEVRKAGRWLHYRLADRDAPRTVRGALRWVRESLAGEENTARDARKLKSILKLPPAVLCCRQREGEKP